MEGERKKRKLENNEEENEEQQMEKFFALLKSAKDVRDRLTKEKKEEKAKGNTLWNPAFQPEDFIDDEELARIHTSHAPASAPSEKVAVEKELPEASTVAAPAAPDGENGNKKKESDDDLDLNLSL